MNKIKPYMVTAALLLLCMAFAATKSVLAHRVTVFAWVEGDTVYVESTFARGKKVKAGEVIVKDMQNNELLRGITNDQGAFSFKVPQRTDLRIVLVAGEGHQAEWTIPATEIEELPSKKARATDVQKSGQAQEQSPPQASLDAMGAPDNVIMVEDLEAIIETVLDRKLKPITRMLADLQQKGPTLRDILGGIGYILGLVGIAAYVQNRKRKE
jgi:nickel transport protein